MACYLYLSIIKIVFIEIYRIFANDNKRRKED